MFFFKTNFSFSDDSEKISAFVDACPADICCARSTDWAGNS